MRSFCLDGVANLCGRAIRLTSRNPVEASVALVVAMALTLLVFSR